MDNDYKCDEYRFYNNGQKKSDGVTKIYYKTQMTTGKNPKLSDAFVKYIFIKETTKGLIAMIHYVGDHTKGVTDMAHGNSNSNRPFVIQMKFIADIEDLAISKLLKEVKMF